MATSSFTSSRTPIFSTGAPTPASRRVPAPSAQSSGWLRPLFGWAPEPDYINAGVKTDPDRADPGDSKLESGRSGPRENLFRGCFTEEKARKLRRKTIESETFHDAMYHSAIASRLASDV